ncbi:sugar ABC transporter substrate-binding protein [Ohessyouella blattaphilus]|uniref:Sugar ABC transporter substrate-binding protein n=1 Tax=Ohessyouella blattaphilus TaxID=2949333 RepID=A0ABT1EIJ1_9FIRM|nr:sugar ABC transporter substrate-binding protein [Ohessyouella blattaphilus]MCP1110520.1 sugar ABC transporter substrate-binding protein [Ohessyouella blattaphilus]MCR8563914.1 sugar ABC transporter substrate-binding protein [Ohessyouella blattaphilus]MDL2249482.1 sugar ABC transporter substrate-binding protein [Lachnospiraceae bacterium OttesenSCG-928-J05]
MSIKKRVLAVLLCVMMVISLTACGGDKSSEENEGETTKTAEPKVGISIWSSTDSLGKACTDLVKSAAADMGGSAMVDVSGLTPEKQVTSVENLISAGCDAITICPFSDAILPKVAKMCEDAEVPFMIYFRQILDPEVKEAVEGSKFYLGNCYEDEEVTGYNMGKSLADKGCKELMIISLPNGDTTAEQREKGLARACDEFGMKVVAEVRDVEQANDATKAVESAIAGFPNLDGVMFVSRGPAAFSGAIQAIKQADKVGEIFVSSIDFPDQIESMETAFEEGILAGVCGGHFPDPMFTTVVLFNYLNGTPLADDNISLTLNFIYLYSLEDVNNYYEFFEGDTPVYNESELAEMLKKNNTDFSVDALQEIMDTYSLEDVMGRRQ